jgi:hypothetical protein
MPLFDATLLAPATINVAYQAAARRQAVQARAVTACASDT